MAKALAFVGGALLLATGIGAIAGAAVFGISVSAAAATISIGGLSLATLGTIGAVASVAGSLLAKRPNAQSSETAKDRLYATIVPTTSRKQVFGNTAMATDVRYQAFTGSNKEYYEQIVCVASHKVQSIDELWFEDKQAWTASGGVTSQYSGYLTVTALLEGSSSNAINIDSIWSAANGCYLTGCAYLYIRYRLTGTSKKTQSPFATSVPNRMTVIGKGRLVYDPRRDSTAGGSGSQRANDQTTWAYQTASDGAGRNPAIVLLNYLLGWQINSKLAVGRGVPVARIDLASFITAANICDETVSLAAGGTEPRYRFDGVIGEDEDGGSVYANIGLSMAGALRDYGGKLSVKILTNDLSAPVLTFTDADVMGPFQWKQTRALDEYRNIIRGRYTDPSQNSLYQLVDYPQVSITAPDGVDRIHTLDLPGVQSASQAQRIAKQTLQRFQFDGELTLPVNARGWAVEIDDCVAVSLSALGWTNMKFRVAARPMRFDGICELILTLEDAAMYAWAAEENPAVVVASPINYDWTKLPWQQANIEDNADVTTVVTGPTEFAVPCDSGGTPKALPATAKLKLTKQGADVTSSATWSVVSYTGTAGSVTFPSAGNLALDTSMTTAEVLVQVKATYLGIDRLYQVKFVKDNDPPPVSSGGGTGGTTASTNSIANSTGSTYASAGISGEISVTTSASGTSVSLTAPLSFYRTTNGTGDAHGKWQFYNGSSWVDVSTETADSGSAFKNSSDGSNDPGSLSVSDTKTGLSNSTTYKFRLLTRSDGSYTLSYSGTCTAVAA